MKKYLLLVITPYETSGGFDDFIGSYETIDEAKKSFDDRGYLDAQIATIKDNGFIIVSEYGRWGSESKPSWHDINSIENKNNG